MNEQDNKPKKSFLTKTRDKLKDKAVQFVKKKVREAAARAVKSVVKKLVATIVGYIGATNALILLLVIVIAAIMGSLFTANAEKETIQKYATVASELQIDWKELVAFDMARYGNKKLDGKDPNNAASYFLTVTEEKFTITKECVPTETDPCGTVNQKKVVTSLNTYQGKQVRTLLGETNLKKSIDSLNEKDGTHITVANHGLEKAMELAGFTQEQRDIARGIVSSKMLEAQFPDIASAGSGGFIPGMCTGPVSPNGKAVNVSASVQKYDSALRQIAQKYGMEQYVEILKAQMMQESGGEGGDPMQASEGRYGDLSPSCRGLSGASRVECITDPMISLEAGVQEFKDVLNAAGGDIGTALQSYNFGEAYIAFAKSKGGHTEEVAKEFSTSYAQRYPSVYNCRGNTNDWRYPACYGDYKYVSRVLRYYEDPGCAAGGQNQANTSNVPSSKGWMWPTKSTRITDTFYSIRGNGQHNAVDIGATSPGVAGDPVWSMEDGVVQRTGYVNGGGLGVYINHGNGIVSRYLHLSRIDVQDGQQVKKGQQIAAMGGSNYTNGVFNPNGYATHLDFQVRINDVADDPLKYFQVK